MIGFKAITFKGKRTAMKAYHTLEEFTPEYFWIDDVAVVLLYKLSKVSLSRVAWINTLKKETARFSLPISGYAIYSVYEALTDLFLAGTSLESNN